MAKFSYHIINLIRITKRAVTTVSYHFPEQRYVSYSPALVYGRNNGIESVTQLRTVHLSLSYTRCLYFSTQKVQINIPGFDSSQANCSYVRQEVSIYTFRLLERLYCLTTQILSTQYVRSLSLSP